MNAIDEMIAGEIIENIDDDKFSIEVEIDVNTIIEVSGRCEIDGYEENDYYNGTGAWIVTDAWVAIDKCEVSAFNEDGEEIETDIKPDTRLIESYVERELKS